VVRADLVYDGRRVAPAGIYYGRPPLEHRFRGNAESLAHSDLIVEGCVACEETLAGAIGIWIRAHPRASKVDLFYR